MGDISIVMGWRRRKTARFMHRYRHALPAPLPPRIGSHQQTRWPASVIETIRQLHALPHDHIDPKSDWLARYVKEGPHGKDRTQPPDHR